MQHTHFDIAIIGGGIFGLTTAICLQKRGHACVVLEQSTIPAELAATTDISKVVRMEYGLDEQYMAMVEAALPRWREWNEELGYDLFHETGVCMFTREKMENGGFEWESYKTLLKRGHHPERLKKDDIISRFPAWKKSGFIDGFYHKKGGYAESGKVLEFLKQKANLINVNIIENFVVRTIKQKPDKKFEIHSRVSLVKATNLIVAAGAWTPYLVPELQTQMIISGHPVFHLKTSGPNLFSHPHFCVFTADIAKTGWYGFPVHPQKGVIKLANHGVGQRLHPQEDERIVNQKDFDNLKNFLRTTFPDLSKAELVYTRRCLYCDTLDEHFWIDWHPEIENLMVATGGSGHGFKFAPILGDIAADRFEQNENAWLDRFKWRNLDENSKGEEAARHHG